MVLVGPRVLENRRDQAFPANPSVLWVLWFRLIRFVLWLLRRPWVLCHPGLPSVLVFQRVRAFLGLPTHREVHPVLWVQRHLWILWGPLHLQCLEDLVDLVDPDFLEFQWLLEVLEAQMDPWLRRFLVLRLSRGVLEVPGLRLWQPLREYLALQMHPFLLYLQEFHWYRELPKDQAFR